MSRRRNKPPLPQLPAGVLAIDSHCHLDMAAYQEDCSAVIRRAADAGVGNIMTIGIDLASSKVALQLAKQYSSLFCAVGVHPHHVADLDEDVYLELTELAKNKEVKAYGEIGLDYARNYASREEQIFHFTRQVKLARELNLPVIIHDREAHDDVMRILKEAAPFPAGGVMHCFSGDSRLAEEVLALGLYISVPGVVTFNKAEMLQEAVRSVPLTSLLLETDGPFLTPAPYRGKRNEPAYVLYTAQKVAELKGTSLDDTIEQTSINCRKLFNLEEG